MLQIFFIKINFFYFSDFELSNSADCLYTHAQNCIAQQDGYLPKKFLEEMQYYLIEHINKIKCYLERNIKCSTHDPLKKFNNFINIICLIFL